MRHLTQPTVLQLAAGASLFSALASYPRLVLWSDRSVPLWYLEATLFFCGIFLWGFVFAWHTRYTRRPVLAFKIETRWFCLATLAAVVVAITTRSLLDPAFQPQIPADYPTNLRQWLAQTLFSLAFNQLFLVFAPFAWCIRLVHSPRVATALTVLFGAFVLAVKIHSLSAHLSAGLTAALVTGRLLTGFLAVSFYLRGGVLLSWWWTLLLEARHLPDLLAHS